MIMKTSESNGFIYSWIREDVFYDLEEMERVFS